MPVISVIEDRMILQGSGEAFRIFRFRCEKCHHIFISHSHSIEFTDLYCSFCDVEPKAYLYRRIKSTS